MRTIRETFAIVTHESAEQGDFAETGWIDEAGESMESDNEEETAVQNAIEFLRRHYAVDASVSIFHPGVWYSTYPESNFRTGDEETRSFHLSGFTDDEEKDIYNAIINADRLKSLAPVAYTR